MQDILTERSGNQCEICTATENLSVYVVPPKKGANADEAVFACAKCIGDMDPDSEPDANHWRCLNDSMWSEVDAVKVIAYRMLTRLKSEGWPADLLDMIYLDDETLAWAKEGIVEEGEKIVHRDSNGVILEMGDSVVIIKDLNVKGSSLVAKRGTAVRNIRLVHDNAEQIEGKVDGQSIVILTQYVKK